MSTSSARGWLRRSLILAALAGAVLFVWQRRSAPPDVQSPGKTIAADRGAARPGQSVSTDPAACGPTDPAGGNTFANAVAARAQREDALAKIAAFTDWLTNWRRADVAQQSGLATVGRDVAAARRTGLKHLIQTDPRRALELALSPGLRTELPAAVQEQLEQRIDNRGELEVMVTHVAGGARYDRMVLVDGKRYEAFVFGRREQQQTKSGLPVHGIAIDGVFALAEEPYRLLDDAEKTARGIAFERIAVAVGSQVKTFASPSELEAAAEQWVKAESMPGPSVIERSSGIADPGAVVPSTAAVTSPPTWINGAKRVLWVQVDFADDPGGVATEAELGVTNAAVSEFYAANSQGKTTMTFTVLPAVLRLPRDKTYYNTSGSTVGELQDNANTLAKAYDAANGGAGTYDPDRYDRWIVVFKRVPAYTFGGQALLGGARVRMNGNIAPGTTGHELGHNQSLDHSHYWLPSGSSATGAGTTVDYGDIFDIMGSSSSSSNNHFNVSQKAKLGYLDSTSITTVTQAGTFRITRHDHKDATGIRALKVVTGELDYEYWVEHRRFGPTAFNTANLDRLRNGVLVHWGPAKAPKFATGPGSFLIDATPGSAGGASDAPFRIGETFVDPDNGVTIKPLAVGGTAPNEYVDVQVSFGAVDGNRNPTLQAALPAGALAARTNIVFNASGSDPDGDPLYYRWDFGDGQLNPTLDNLTRRFLKGGTYSLRVSAHDGKGGIATRTIPVEIADPLVSWTKRGGTGATTQFLYDVIYGGGKFIAAGINQTVLSSTDGITWSNATFPSGNSLTGVAYSGARYVLSGYRFNNATQKGLVAYSDDGTNWTLVPINTGLAQFWGIAYGAGRFVVVGDSGVIYYSVDGITWTAASSGITNAFRAVTYADGLFVATGDSGRVFTSTDGITWTNRSLATANAFNGAVRHNGQWIVRAFTTIFTSADGATWTRVTGPAVTSTAAFKLISSGGLMFAPTTNGTMDFAENAQTWASVRLDTTAGARFNSAAAGNGLIVAVGTGGNIYSANSPQPAAAPLAAPALRNEADSLKVSVGKKNVLAASGTGFTRLELYANGTKVSEISGSSGALSWTPASIGSYSLVLRGIEASGASVVSAEVSAVSGFANWSSTNLKPGSTDLRGAVRVGNKWWIVGSAGSFYTLDGNGTFNVVDFPTSQHLTSIAYANGRFIVTGPFFDAGAREDIGALWTSTDGYTWTPLLTTVFDNFNLNFAAFGGDKWVTGSTGGTLLTSTDGINWTRQISGLTTSIRSGAFGAGTWVLVGNGGRVITSADGSTWTARTSGVTTDLISVSFNNGTFVASGSAGVILTSRDGISWTRQTSGVTGVLNSVGFVKGVWVVVGDNSALLTSADAVTWASGTMEDKTVASLFVAGSGDDGIILGRAGEVFTATTASSWKRMNQGTSESRFSVIYAGGRFISVGQSTDTVTRTTVVPISVSTDGINWTRATGNINFNSMNDVAFGQQRYVAVGDNSRVFTSTDGIAWTQRTFTVTSTLTCVTAGPNLFVAASSGAAIYTSPDGTTWSQRAASLGTAFRAAAYGNGRYVIVGDGGGVHYSVDGTTWERATSGVTAALLTAGYFDNIGFIAAGNSGTMIRSTDGITWQPMETGVADNIAAIAQTPIGLVASAGTNGSLLISLDGSGWTIGTLPSDRMIRGLAASPSALVAVGDNGTALTFEFVDTTPAPVITTQPSSQAAVPGSSVAFTVDVRNGTGAVYQWFKDGAAIPGANTPVYLVPSANSTRAGDYTVSITTATGTVLSAAATLSLPAAADPGRLVNLSILTSLTSRDDTFTFGVVVGGSGTVGSKALLVRAAGPSLTALGVTGVLDDPKLEFYTGVSKVGENDNWGGSDSTRAAMAAVGAFPFANNTSRDAAIFLPSLATGANSARISGTGAGTVIAELYDATPTNSFTAATPRLINVSVLKHIGAGVTAGFVIGGSSPRTVLVRAIGPTLGAAPFNVGGVVADPQLALFSGTTQILANDNWGGTIPLTAAFSQVGAFALPATSRDAALLVELQPGSYTVQVAGIGGTGIALIEVYEVP